MHPRSEAEQVIAEALEGYVLGGLSPEERELLAVHLNADPTLQVELAEARARIDAVRQSQAGAGAPQGSVDGYMLAAYLDDALDPDARAALEAQFSCDPQLVARLVALHRETQDVTDSNSAVVWTEKFLAGSVIPFEAREVPLSQYFTVAYVSLEDAIETRKRRYLHG